MSGGERARILAVGSLSTATRSLAGVLAQSEWFEIDDRRLRSILQRCGLPARAVEEPDFLISMDQELALVSAMLADRRDNASLTAFGFAVADWIDTTLFGVTGLAMLHAPSFLDAVRVYLDFPQLFWGHSRMVVRADEAAVTIRFSFDPPASLTATGAEREALARYCLLLDLVSITVINSQIMGPDAQASAIQIPFEKPDDAASIADHMECPVRFNCDFAELILPPGTAEAVPVRARPLIYRGNLAACRELARLQPVQTGMAEQAERWLWAYSPPLSRHELADRLGLSERSLARRLAAEGSSYHSLFAKVQSERATNLLRNAGLSIAEVGYRLGYADPAAFTRAFSGWTGMTPSAWRSALQ